jgi:hypothetical protein
LQLFLTPQWLPDFLGTGFSFLELKLHDNYDGPAVATLVQRAAENTDANELKPEPRSSSTKSAPSSHVARALLFLPSFSDFFWNTEMANTFAENGYGCGRVGSLLFFPPPQFSILLTCLVSTFSRSISVATAAPS